MNAMRCVRTITAVCCFLFIIHHSSFIVAQEVEWRTDYNKARQEATEKSRPLMLDFGTENCVHCKKLDAMTFRDPAVVGILNKSFVPLRIDAEKNSALAEALRVERFPTLLLAAPDGKILATQEGYLDSARCHDWLQRGLSSLANPDWMTRDYQEAVKAAAASDSSRAAALLRGIIEDKGNRPVQQKARQMLADLEQQPASRPENKSPQRTLRARDLLAQAREDYRGQRFLACLDRCDEIVSNYADLPEGVDAMRLAAQIKNNPDWMKQVCESLSDRLGGLYLSLAETLLKKGQPQQAAIYLERVVQTFPGTRQAEAAQVRLAQIQSQPAQTVDFKRP